MISYSRIDFSRKIRAYVKEKNIKPDDFNTKARLIIPGEKIKYEHLDRLFKINLFLDLNNYEAITDEEIKYILKEYHKQEEVDETIQFLDSLLNK